MEDSVYLGSFWQVRHDNLKTYNTFSATYYVLLYILLSNQYLCFGQIIYLQVYI